MEGRITRSKSAKQQATSITTNKTGKTSTTLTIPVFGDENNPNVFIHPNKRITNNGSSSSSSSSHVVVKKPSNLQQSTPLRLETKKMQISDTELSMNGAPEGDLYDVQILNDSELFAFDSAEMAEAAFQTACSLKKDSSSWADLFSVVEVIRRLALHHQPVLLFSDLLGEGVDSAIEAVVSLRSSTIRNGILCLKALAAIENMNAEYICRIVATLMGRTSCGPRFICDTATLAVEETIALLSPQLSIDALTSSTLLKNSDSAGKAFVLIAQSVIRLYSQPNNPNSSSSSAASAVVTSTIGSVTQNTDDNKSCSKMMTEETPVISEKIEEDKSNHVHDDLLRLLSRGLSARTPSARESSRLALKRMKVHVGQEAFVTAVNATLPELLAKEVHREVEAQCKPAALSTTSTSMNKTRPPSAIHSSLASTLGRPTSSSSSIIRPSANNNTNGSSSINPSSFKSAGGGNNNAFIPSSSSRPSSAAMTINSKTTSTTTTTKNKFSSFAAVGSAAFRPVTATAPLVTIFSSIPVSSNSAIPIASGTSSTGVGCSNSTSEEGSASSTQPVTKQTQLKIGHGQSNSRGAMAPTTSSTLAARPSIRERMLQQQQLQQQQPQRFTTTSRPTGQSPPYILKTKEIEPITTTSGSTGYAMIVPANVLTHHEPSSSSNIINGNLDI